MSAPAPTARFAPAAVRDAAWGVVLGAVAVVYLAYLPRNLSDSDEGLFLYEAKRLLAGDVFYRDIFDIVTPGAHYLMALLFGLFGTDMATARLSTAVLHGLIVAVTYLIARRLGVGRALAALAGAAHLALCQSAWAYASPHWLSTWLTMAALYLLVVRPRSTFLLGLVCGVMVMVQQHHGAVMTAGAGTLLLCEQVVLRRSGRPPGLRSLRQRLTDFVLGVAAVTVPCFLALAAAAGPGVLLESLVLQPLRDYGAYHDTFTGFRWGFFPPTNKENAVLTIPVVLRWLPVALLLDLARAASAWHDRDAGRLWPRVLLLVLALFSMLSILNYPDFIHVAFIAAIFFVAIADHVAWALRHLPGPPAGRRLAGGMLTVSLASAVVAQLGHHQRVARALFPVSHQTAFGRVDYRRPANAEVVDLIRTLLDPVPGREFFCYPVYPALYLTVGGWNPTPYQLLMPLYSPAWQLERTIAILKARRPPVVALVPFGITPHDPVLDYITAEYEVVNDGIAAQLFVMKRVEDPPPA